MYIIVSNYSRNSLALIIEMLTNLDQLRGIKEFEVIALPPKFDTAGSFVRVIAIPIERV